MQNMIKMSLAVKKINTFTSVTGLNIIKRFYCKSSSQPSDEPKIPKNVLKDIYSASYQKENGIIAGKKPFKTRLEAGKTYSWCLCGQSHEQPFCDKTHKNIFLKIKLRPIWFKVEETKDYWLCTCKQTSNRPFCDGTHKRADIQEKKFL